MREEQPGVGTVDFAPASGERWARVWPVALLNVVGLFLAWNYLNGSLGEWGGDNVQFLLLAEALGSGAGYVDLHLPGFPPHLNYPPAYPALLAPLVALGAPLVALKAFTAALGLAGVNVCYLVLARWIDRDAAFLACVSTLCCGVFLDSGLSVMSESPFLLLSSASILLVEKSLEPDRRRPVVWLAAGVLMGLSVLTRLVGVVLGPAAVFAAWFLPSSGLPALERMRRLAVVGIAAAAVAGPWFVRGAVNQSRGTATYLQEFARSDTTLEKTRAQSGELPGEPSLPRRVLSRPLDNVRDLARLLTRTAMPGSIQDWGPNWTRGFLLAFLALAALFAGLAMVGLVRGVVRRRSCHDFYVFAYLALLSIWLGGGFRLLMPILPFLLAYVYEGTLLVARGLRKPVRAGRSVLIATVAVNLLVTTQFPLFRDRLAGRYQPWWGEFLRASCRLAEIARPEERVIAAPDNVVFYLTGLQVVRVPVRGGGDAVLERLLTSGADYVVITPFGRWRYGSIIRAVEEHPERFSPVLREGRVRIVRIGGHETDHRVPGIRQRRDLCRTLLP